MKKENLIEILFESNYKDSKHKLNTTNKKVDSALLEQIEDRGITTEELEVLKTKKFDIYTYQTQITIHGIFKLENNRIGGYKNLTLNKNLSLGIRWNAIDVEKKSRIKKYVTRDNWNFQTDSKGTILEYVLKTDDSSKKQELVNILIEKSKRIKTPFFGTKTIQSFNYFGRIYIVLSISLDGIFEKNVNSFIEDVITMKISDLDLVFENERIQYELEAIENKKKQDQIKQNNLDLRNRILEKFKNHNIVKEIEVGTFIEVVGIEKFRKVEVKKAFGKFSCKRSEYSTSFEDVKNLEVTKSPSNYFATNPVYIKIS